MLGETMRGLGFGWVAVQVADGSTLEPVGSFVTRFRAASGLPIGGWSVLRGDPAAEARLAAGIVRRDGLDFEQEYAYTNGADKSSQRYARSRQFVDAFRAAEPTLPAAISSYCRPDMHDLDWGAWAGAGFDFLPQAYVGDLGPEGDPAVCVRAAARFFPQARVHPTIGIFPGRFETPTPPEYAALLQAAGTTDFSLYPAENATELWQAYGQQLQVLPLAHRVP